MKKTRKLIRSFATELGVYSVLVTGYFLLVMHFLSGWLKTLFDTNRLLYAVVALLLMIGQGFLLELVTRRLLGLVRSKTE